MTDAPSQALASSRSRGAADTEPRDERARGRELALLALCHLESYPPAEHGEALELLWGSPPRGDDERGSSFVTLVRDPDAHRWAVALLRDLVPRLDSLDAVLSETSVRWRIDRMAQVDRNVLRLVAFELEQRPQTPRAVVLAEAVRLARRYGSERSAGFVNGVAEALAQRLRPAVAAAEGDG
ncbi:transcription antitermination factor NusB [Paraliomyxa miuraensis]|uniref:transcription antitermination factor NusB n=1 Tax=Paraliomyxa miuraensis TaxID=376150 RepID=UPI002250D205|nr:transcription antitermination factor NusB [Paraliomyxa miuraensis]MCX4245794.1 N utilization substance protein B [Paraliomyxa miuraensis]